MIRFSRGTYYVREMNRQEKRYEKLMQRYIYSERKSQSVSPQRQEYRDWPEPHKEVPEFMSDQ